MPRALEGRPGRQVGTLNEKTVHAAITKARIHAIVGQVIDELEQRRAKGKGDYVAALANEVEEGGLAAWRSLLGLAASGRPKRAQRGSAIHKLRARVCGRSH